MKYKIYNLNYFKNIYFFLDTFFIAVGHMVRYPVLEGGGWGGGVRGALG